MKQLVLCRHAKSSWKYDTEDIYRPLNRRGICQAPEMARRWQGGAPDAVISSPAVRAYATALAYIQECQWPTSILTLDWRMLEASADQLRKVLSEFADDVDTVWLFGHNPGLNILTEFLSQQPVENIVTGARVGLTLKIDHWSAIDPGCATLAAIEKP